MIQQVLSRKEYRTCLLASIGIVTIVSIVISFNSTLSKAAHISSYDYSRKELIDSRIKNPKATMSLEKGQETHSPQTYQKGTCRSSTWGPEWTVDSNGGICKHGQIGRNGCCLPSTTIHSTVQTPKITQHKEGTRSPLSIPRETNADADEKDNLNLSKIDVIQAKPTSDHPIMQEGDITEDRTQETMPTCSAEHQCCSQYEFCVSSCLNFVWEHTHSTTVRVKKSKREDGDKTFDSLQILMGQHHADDANVAKEYSEDFDIFDWCLLRCRTSGRSVIHQNSFRSTLKHCYGVKDPPLLARIVQDHQN